MKARPPALELDDADFARAVVELYEWNVAPLGKKRAYKGDAPREVCQCANGLALIKHLLNEFMHRNTLTGTDIAESGVADAYAIVDHLVTGRAHPIRRHIRGQRTAGQCPSNPPANDFDRLVQRIVVGATRALMVTEPNLRASAHAIIEGLARRNSEFSPTVDQIKGWHGAFTKAADPGPDALARAIIQQAEMLETTALDEGLRMIIEHTAVARPSGH